MQQYTMILDFLYYKTHIDCYYTLPLKIFDMTLGMSYFLDQDLGKGKSKLSRACLFHIFNTFTANFEIGATQSLSLYQY